MNRYQQIKEHLNESFDIIERVICNQHQQAYVFFLSSLSDNQLLERLCEGLTLSIWQNKNFAIFPCAMEECNSVTQAISALLSGQCIVLIDEVIYLVETRSYPSRSSAEPMNEQSIRGAHDGFVENIIFNVGLLRRRIRDPRLMIQIKKIGSLSRCDIVYAYLEGKVNPYILKDFEMRLASNEQVDCMNAHDFVALIYRKTLNPYPCVRYSERADLCALHLMQGYLIVMVDNSPYAIIMPTTLIEQMSQMEEFTQTLCTANFTRIIRYCGVLFSVYLLPLWCALLVDKNPTMLKLPMLEIQLYTFAFQVLFADVVIEWLRQALIHTPNLLSGIMSLIAVFVLGEMAIEQGAYTQEVLIMIALVNIGNALTPGYELSMANKISRILLVIVSLWAGQIGFLIGVLVHLYILLHAGLNIPYLYPLLPFSFHECLRILKGGKE